MPSIRQLKLHTVQQSIKAQTIKAPKSKSPMNNDNSFSAYPTHTDPIDIYKVLDEITVADGFLSSHPAGREECGDDCTAKYVKTWLNANFCHFCRKNSNKGDIKSTHKDKERLFIV